MVEECSEGDSVENGGSGVERGRVATPQVSLPVPYCIPLQQVRQTYVPAQTGGTANGSLVDEKEKTAHRSAHPTNRAVTSQPTAMHHRPTELLKASQLCGQKADQLSCLQADQPSHSKVWPSPAPYQVRVKSLAKSSAVPSAGLLSLAKSSAVPSAGHVACADDARKKERRERRWSRRQTLRVAQMMYVRGREGGRQNRWLRVWLGSRLRIGQRTRGNSTFPRPRQRPNNIGARCAHQG